MRGSARYSTSIATVATVGKQSAWQIVLPAGVLVVFGLVLPIRSTIVGRRSATPECLALTAELPPGSAADRLALYERCLALDPEDVELMARLAAQLEDSDPARADALYRRALTIDPAYASVRLRLGELLLRRGDMSGARQEAAAALKSRPNNRTILDLLQRAGAAPPGAAQ